ncbi:MAG: hypothetical protein ACI9NC_005996, partial [Verrucomicrobiales bacterium]
KSFNRVMLLTNARREIESEVRFCRSHGVQLRSTF